MEQAVALKLRVAVIRPQLADRIEKAKDFVFQQRWRVQWAKD